LRLAPPFREGLLERLALKWCDPTVGALKEVAVRGSILTGHLEQFEIEWRTVDFCDQPPDLRADRQRRIRQAKPQGVSGDFEPSPFLGRIILGSDDGHVVLPVMLGMQESLPDLFGVGKHPPAGEGSVFRARDQPRRVYGVTDSYLNEAYCRTIASTDGGR
jgi:hypothetical protein